jgi:hypothetical protein
MKTCLFMLAVVAIVTAGCESDMNAGNRNAPAYEPNSSHTPNMSPNAAVPAGSTAPPQSTFPPQ